MNRVEVARVLAEIGMLAELNGENAHRTRAFTVAARSLEAADVELAALAAEGKLTDLRGVGTAIAETIQELLEMGASRQHQRLLAETPAGLYALLKVPGLGGKRAHRLHAELGIDSLDALETAARAGRISQLSGFGAKTEQKMLDGIAFVRSSLGWRRFPAALEAALDLEEAVAAHPKVSSAEIAGEVRRRREIAGAVELVAVTTAPAAVRRWFAESYAPGAEQPDAKSGEPLSARLTDGLRVRLHLATADEQATRLAFATGSAEHWEQLAAHAVAQQLRLEPAGLWRGDERVPLAREEELYERLGLSWVSPELREGAGEIEAAAAGGLPELVRLEELRGTFHCHTVASDGKQSAAEMAAGAIERGWSFLGIADHSQSAAYAGGLSASQVAAQRLEIDAWNAAYVGADEAAFRLFHGIESDILPDGSLDYPEDVLASFDYVVGSVHSAFGMTEAKMTARIVRAVRNPHLTILGHPTGRLLLTRDAYPVDVNAVIDACAEHGVVIEINSDPHRLDLDWRHLRRAAAADVLIAINPDAHSVRALDNVAFGINIARKGWLEARQVLNAWPLDEVERHFAQRKQAR